MYLQAEYNEGNNSINVTWTGSSNFPDEDLGYQITYSIVARNVTLLSANDTIFNASVDQMSALFEYQITENVLPGVTVSVMVRFCTRLGLGPPTTASETVPGGMFMYIHTYLYTYILIYIHIYIHPYWGEPE